MEARSDPGPDREITLSASGVEDIERRLLATEQGSSASDSPGRSTSKTLSVRLSSSSARGARWGQCVYDPDGGEFGEKTGCGDPGGSQGLARDVDCAFPEERKVPSERVSRAGYQSRKTCLKMCAVEVIPTQVTENREIRLLVNPRAKQVGGAVHR